MVSIERYRYRYGTVKLGSGYCAGAYCTYIYIPDVDMSTFELPMRDHWRGLRPPSIFTCTGTWASNFAFEPHTERNGVDLLIFSSSLSLSKKALNKIDNFEWMVFELLKSSVGVVMTTAAHTRGTAGLWPPLGTQHLPIYIMENHSSSVSISSA